MELRRKLKASSVNLTGKEFDANARLKMKLGVLLLMFFCQFVAITAMAQEKESVMISGVIFDEDSTHRALPDVAVYNRSKGSGTISNERGEFKIEIGRTDTLVFSTVQHMDEGFFFIENEPFEDRVISISMKMDTVWLNVITVMGNSNYEAFKKELLAMELPENDHSMILPVVNKYAEEYSTGKAGIKIHGPLTYLSKKIRAWKKRGVNAVDE